VSCFRVLLQGEDDAKFQAEQQIEEARERIKDNRTQVRKLTAELRDVLHGNLFENRPGTSLPPTICATLRRSIESAREDSHKAWARIKELQDDYWPSTPDY
jgi:hypothetical protein